MMKILYVISDRNIGGAGIQLLNILRHLNRREFAVTVALPFRSRLRERLLAAHIRIRELENPCEELSLRAVCELARVIREEHPDIVHTNAAVAARVAGKLTGRRVIFTRRGERNTDCGKTCKPSADRPRRCNRGGSRTGSDCDGRAVGGDHGDPQRFGPRARGLRGGTERVAGKAVA